jgi:SAM-dependent methyltransferase
MIRWHRKTIYEALGREPVHPFPARMAPGIALEVLTAAKTPFRVLDPMMGSGTVIALARSNGHRAIGVDIDPLAVLISRVWTTAIDAEEVRYKAEEVFERARSIFSTLSSRDAYPRHADIETRRFVAYWFDEYARRQLTSLATAIGRVRDNATRDVLWCGLSRLIITKQSGASLAMDLSHSRPHKVFNRAPTKPFRKFLAAVDHVIENCVDKRSAGRGPATCTHEGDARDLPLGDASVDLVLTSPPYLNAIDYMRCSKFSLVWMGYSISALHRIRAASVGSEVGRGVPQADEATGSIMARLNLRPPLAAKEQSVLARYVDDMRRALSEVARVLIPGGRALYIVGENTIRGTYIPNAAIVTMVASLSGLKLCDRRTRTIPSDRRYLPPPSARNHSTPLDARVRREVVLSFTKPRVQ